MSEFDESNLPPRQLQVWIAQKLLSNQAVYNLPIALTISGNIDPVCFQRAFQTLINSSDALRMIFEEVRGIPIRRVIPELGYDLPFLDFSTRPDATAAAQSWLRENAIKTFDLERRLFDAALLKVSADEFIWYLNMHHLISDAWSVQLIYQCIARLYALAIGGDLPNKIALNSFEAVAPSEDRAEHSARATKAKAYWKQKLSGDCDPLRFYGTAANKAGTSVTRKVYDLGRERSEKLKRVIREIDHRDSRDDVLLLNAFYAVLCAYLARFHDHWNCFVGVASHNRRGSVSKQTIGFFSEVLPVRVSVHEEDSFASLARKINAEVFETMRHGNFAVTDPVRGPVYDVVLNYHKAAFNDFGGRPAHPEWIHTGHGFESFMLQVHDFSSAGRLLLSFDFHDEIFSEQQAEMAIRHFLAVLDTMAANPNRPIARLDLVSPDDLRLLLRTWNATETAASPDSCVTAAFEEQVEKNSAAVAVVSGNETLSYGDLNRRANRLARYVKRFGVGPNSLVGIYLDRSFEMVVAILAVLKAGGAYVPIDPNSPVDRVAFVIKDTGLSLMLTCRGLVEKLPECPAEVICLDSAWEKISHESDQNLNGRPRSDDLAYAIYTSGSTGDPKGVEISHGALGNFSSWAIGAYQLSPSDRVLQFAAVGFDAAIEEIFPTLLRGATLVLRAERSIASIQAFVEHCRDWQVSVVDLPTSYWHELTRTLCRENMALPESIRLVIIGGEAASPKLLAEWRQVASRGCRLVNTYGPTEATVVATACDLTDAADTTATSAPVPIGRPIANVRVYVLDRRLEPVPIGVAGELFIAGAGLAAGYRNSPALTARNFITKSFGYGLEERLYRTGDIVRYRGDGRLEFLGRSDDQLKIMGYRVEPKEIESTLAQYPGVKETIATPFSSENDERRIAAYVVPQAGANVTADELRAYLSRKLPAYMIPAAIVFTEKFVRSANGKIDRKALPQPLSSATTDADAAAARSPVEQGLVEIWHDILSDAQVDIHKSFFEIGGHSLSATQVMSRVRESFRVELPLRAIFETPTIAGLANQIQLALQTSRGAIERPPITPVSRSQELPVSFSQARMWFMHQIAPESPAYNLGVALRLIGPLDRSALTSSFGEIVRRHEAIRTVFPSVDGQPRQVVTDWSPVHVRVIDLQNLPLDQRLTKAKELVSEESRRPFNLERDLLMRVLLIRLGEDEHVLAVNMHHIASDQWSMGIIARELTHLYNSFCTESQAQLNPVTLQYSDFAVWQRQWLTGEVLQQQLQYWKEHLKGLQPIALPTDRPRPSVQSFNGAFVTYDIPTDLIDRLKALGAQEAATLYMTFLTAFKILLCRYSGRADIAVGSPIANRNWLAVENIVGTFVNTLVLRTDLSGDPSFRELLSRVRDVTINAFARQETPFEKLVEELQPQRDPSRSPLVQVLFNFQNAPLGDVRLHGLTWTPFEFELGASQFDLCLAVDPNVLNKIVLVYNPDLFNEARAARMLEHYTNLLEAFARDPNAKISQVDFLSQFEKGLLSERFACAQANFPAHLRMHELFEAQVKRSPHAAAVEFEGEQLTYQELNKRANQLARHLCSLGIRSETPVGVYLERSVEMVVALLGILKAGGAYVPLDPDYPAQRVAMMIEDSASPVILTQERLRRGIPKNNARLVRVDQDWPDVARQSEENLNTVGASDDLAYVIFTSGSTGRPKGVEITHKALVNFLVSMAKEPGIDASDVMLSVTPLAFDISALEIFLPLTVGAQVTLLPREIAVDGRLLKERVDASSATVMQATPMTWRMLIEAGWRGKTNLKILCGGEALSPDLAHGLLTRGAAVFNMYGPTETTIWSTLWKVASGSGPMVIGYPIANTTVHVLDADLRPLPLGIEGDLYIGGVGLARGYRGNPELTREKFIRDPFSDEASARLFKTGDRARYLSDGTIEHLGRSDFQVKVRGHRIELGEVEAALIEHPSVKQCVVIAKHDATGENQLVSYIVPAASQGIDQKEIQHHLREKLPDYMVPTSFISLSVLPLTPNGKIDRNNLPVPERPPQLRNGKASPHSLLEMQLVRIWRELLQVGRVGVADSFFDLGGHSLLAIRLIAQIEKLTGKSLPAATLFRAPTIRQLAEILADPNQRHPWASLVPIQLSGAKNPLFLIHADTINLFLPSYLGDDRPIFALEHQSQDGTKARYTEVETLAKHYLDEIRTVQPQGPYLLAGYSFGGVIAFEMAQRLQSEKQEVALLALLDTMGVDQQRAGPSLPSRITDAVKRVPHVYESMMRQTDDRPDHRARAMPRVGIGDFVRIIVSRAFRDIGVHVKTVLSQVYASLGYSIPLQLRSAYILNVYRQAARLYAPQPYPGRVIFIKSTMNRSDPRIDWGALVTGRFKVCEVPGDHRVLREKDNVDAWAPLLRVEIEAAEEKTSFTQSPQDVNGEVPHTLDPTSPQIASFPLTAGNLRLH